MAYLLGEAAKVRALASGRSDLTVEVQFVYMSFCPQHGASTSSLHGLQQACLVTFITLAMAAQSTRGIVNGVHRIAASLQRTRALAATVTPVY